MTSEKSPTQDEMAAARGQSHIDGSDRKPLSPAAQRALAEAEERRAKSKQEIKPVPKELEGPKGLEPTRYGDWERKGIISDF